MCKAKEPIAEFKTTEEAVACLKEWQTRLFLDDWIIKVALVEPSEIEGLCGRNEFRVEIKSSMIRLVIPNEDVTSRIAKFCHEEILVHELLHCKYNWVNYNGGTYEQIYFDTLDHALIEQMAKTLIMAKYNLPFEWFKNF